LAAQGSKEHFNQLTTESQAIVSAHYLMDQLNRIQEIANKNTGNLNDSVQRLHAEWKQFSEDFGSLFIPVATRVLGKITELITLVKETTNALGDLANAAFRIDSAGGDFPAMSSGQMDLMSANNSILSGAMRDKSWVGGLESQ